MADDLPECSGWNVTSEADCDSYCGDVYNTTSNYKVFSAEEHTVDGLDVRYLTRFDCVCGDADDESNNSTACSIPYEFPTCESKGLGDCGMDHDHLRVLAEEEMTCEELCVSLGVGTDEDNHVCHHVEDIHEFEDMDAHDGHDHARRRQLSEDGDHEEESATMCFCKAAKAGKGLMVCGDEGWSFDDHEKESSSISRSVVSSGVVAGIALVSLAI